MARARQTVLPPAQPAGPGAAAKQSWLARPKQAGEPRSGVPGAVDEAVPKPAPALLSEGYLAAARQAATAARTRAAGIRAAQQERSAMPGPERRLPERPAAPPAGAIPAQEPPVAGAAVVAGRRGLSVAEAAQASTLAFSPLRRSSDLPLRQADPIDGSQGALPAPAAAAPPPAQPPLRVGLERVEQRQRFAKTIAELERYQAAAGRKEPGANIVPRPALARPDQSDAAGSPWSRLWARRKDPAAE